MKKVCAVVAIVLCCQVALVSSLQSQDRTQTSSPNHYYTLKSKGITANDSSGFFFTRKHKRVDEAWIDKNEAYLLHPDTGFVDKYVPSDRAVELFDKRTRDSKQYVDRDTVSKFYILKSIGAIHYLKDGQWLTIDERLEPQGDKRFEANRQVEPVGLDANRQTAYIKSLQGTVYFNNWVLYGLVDGAETLLAKPDWSHYAAGDEGIYITNIFPGIDAEMKVGRGTVKTSFIVRRNNFATAQQLIFKDGFKSESDGRFEVTENASAGSSEADYVVNNQNALHVSSAIAYGENDAQNSTIELLYFLSRDTLSLPVDASFLNRHLAEGNVVIDPLVSSTNTLAQTNITGSMDCGSIINSCDYTLLVPSPPKATITAEYFQFGFQTVGTALNKNGYWGITTDTCGVYCSADPSNNSAYNSHGSVSTMGSFSDITDFVGGCMPAPSCVSQNIPFTLNFYNDICTGSTVCSSTKIKAEEAFVIMIEGHTGELSSISSAASLCLGQSTTLAALGKYGVPPYIYTWNNGAGSGSNVTVAPTATTVYTVTVADQCGTMATGSVAVTVNAPTVGTSTVSICQGESYSLGGKAYTTAGTYTGHLTNVAGCDSTVTLHLSVLQSKQTAITAEICSGEVYPFGSSQLTKTGSYTNHLLTSQGCDSAVTLTLTVKPTSTSYQTVNLLYGDSYSINGHSYDMDGTYTDVFEAANGCDSIIVTTIAILRSLCPAIVVPSYFSPNDDGVNDFFEIENILCYLKSTVDIFDRYGKRVAHYAGTDLGWDGKYLGKQEPSADYWYVITLPETGSRAVGHFTLKR